MAATPITPGLPLEQEIGSTRTWTGVASSTVGPFSFTYADILVATVSAQKGGPAVLTPAVGWTNPTTNTYTLSIFASEFAPAGITTAGAYSLVIVANCTDGQPRVVFDGLISFTPIGGGAASQYDLTTYAYVVTMLQAAGVTPTDAQLQVIPTLITEASKEITRFCGRPFVLTSYNEIVTPEGGRQDRGEPASASLSYFPVVGTPSVRVGRSTALLVSNTDASTNQDASIAFAFSGDVEFQDLVYTGLTLTRTASGTTTTNSVTWTTASPYTTIASVAASINAIGGGWSATLQGAGDQPDPTLMPAAWLVGAREPKGGFSPGAGLDVFARAATNFDIDRATGILRLYGGFGGGGFGGGFGGSSWGDPFGASWDGMGGFGGVLGFSQYRVSYQAGFTVVPEPIQQACCEVVKATLDRMGADFAIESERAKDYSYTVKSSWAMLPDWCLNTLRRYKDRWV